MVSSLEKNIVLSASNLDWKDSKFVHIVCECTGFAEAKKPLNRQVL